MDWTFVVGDIVRFSNKNGEPLDYCYGPLYTYKDDLFKITKIVNEKRFYSGIGIYIKSIPCPFCTHKNEAMSSEIEKSNGFDSGWFEKL